MYKELLKYINHFVFDIDGVLTNGDVEICENGNFIRRMFVKDGYAIHHAISKGYNMCIISGGKGSNLIKRLNDLGIKDIYLQIEDKRKTICEYKNIHNISKESLLYMGDDNPDICVKDEVALLSCPCDASIDIREVSGYISPFGGGRGCVRDIIEQTMRVQGNW